MLLDDSGDETLFRQLDQECAAREAANRLFVKYYDPLLFFLRRKFPLGEDIIRDLAQETCRKAWEKRATFEQRSSFFSWLRSIGMRVGFDYMRSWKREKEHVIPLGPEHDRGEMSSLLAEEEVWELIREIIRALPEQHQWCAQLYFLEHRSLVEIAQRLHLSQDTVRTYISTVRKKVYKALNGANDTIASKRSSL